MHDEQSSQGHRERLLWLLLADSTDDKILRGRVAALLDGDRGNAGTPGHPGVALAIVRITRNTSTSSTAPVR